MRASAICRLLYGGGGHVVVGFAVCDGGVVLDISPMKRIEVDPAGRTVRAGAGVLWSELDRATQAFGLATTGGRISTTGIAGLTPAAAAAGSSASTGSPPTTCSPRSS